MYENFDAICDKEIIICMIFSVAVSQVEVDQWDDNKDIFCPLLMTQWAGFDTLVLLIFYILPWRWSSWKDFNLLAIAIKLESDVSVSVIDSVVMH